MLFALVLGRKGVSYIQFLPYLYFSEIILLLIFLNIKKTYLGFVFTKSFLMLPFLLFSYGAIYLTLDIYDYGIDSIDKTGVKDFALMFYPIAIIASYMLLRSYQYYGEKHLIKILSILFLLNSIISITYPLRNILIPYVYHIEENIPIIFTYSANTFYLPSGLLFFLQINTLNKNIKIIGVILSLVGIILLMERNPIVSIIVTLMFMFLFINRSVRILKFKSIIITSAVLILSLSSFLELDSIKGMRVKMDIEGYSLLLESIINPVEDEDLNGTRSHRMYMWKTIFDGYLKEDIYFGAGYTKNIGDVIYVTFRSPHNSFLHILWRFGLIGILLIMAMLTVCLIIFVRYYKKNRMYKNDLFITTGLNEWFIMIIIVGIMDSMFATLLESPFSALPYYFLLGTGLYLYDKNKQSNINEYKMKILNNSSLRLVKN